ncbi:MAG: molecular chaperone DnaK [Proteobacteria bacterium]|nr:molecular chaperone DnaK [Pseudomonadota bacterium]
MAKEYIIGIDLGTTKSVVAIYENGSPKILENLMGKRITPSFVAVKKDKKTGDAQWLVGDNAKNQVITNSLNTIYGVKRLIGRRYDDPEVTKMKSLASYKIVEGPNGDAWVELDGKAMAPAQVSAMVLTELKKAAEKYLGNDENGNPIEVKKAVITCPAYFNDSQIKATKDAGTIAGLDVLRIIKEPTAAALAYGMDKNRSGKVIVYDLGGGTFDVSLLEISMDETADKSEGSMIKVLSTNGDTFLGGENFDERIMDHLIDALKAETGLDLKSGTTPAEKSKNASALQRIKDAAEKVKIELSSQETADISLPFIGVNADGEQVNFEYTLTRIKLEQLVQDLIDRTKGPCQKALADAGLTTADIDDVLLVGAQTRMPKVVETVKNLFNREPRKDVSVQEIVAMGASVQGAILEGTVAGVVLVDVIPLSIGIRTMGDVMTDMIKRNSTIPAEAKDVFSTSEDNQRNVEIKVYQGERAKASENKLLGSFVLDGIPPAPRGKPQIEVTFSIDADGVLQVHAEDLATHRAQKITVKANGGLSDAEVEQMLKDAEKNAEQDRLFKARQLATVYAADELKEAAQDTKEEYYTKAPTELKESFDLTVKELTEAVAKKDPDVMIEKTAKLKEIRTALGAAFYEAAAQKQDEKGTAPSSETSAAKPDNGGGATPNP